MLICLSEFVIKIMLLMTLHVILGSFFHTLMIQVVVNDQNFNANNCNFRNSFNPKV